MTSVSEIIADRTAAVDQTTSQAEAHLKRLLEISNVEFSDNFNIDALLPKSYNYAQPSRISFPVFAATAPTVDVTIAPAPEAPAPISFSTVTDVMVPDLAAVAPSLDLPALPSSTLPTAPAGAPEFISPAIPSAPVITFPAVPTFASLALPDPPSIDLPSFAGSLPVDDLLVPSNTFEYAEQAYDSALLDSLKAKLLEDLQNGSYGIEPSDEAALLQRTRGREAEAMLTRVTETRRSFASRGFQLPPDEVAIYEAAAQQEMQSKTSSVNRDIALDRSRRYTENRRFTIEQVKEVNQILINFHNSVQERALNVARATLEASLSIYNARVQRHQARLQGYQTAATAFAERVRAELAKAEIYRVQVEAAGLTIEVQKNLVDVYRAQLLGIKTSVDIYKVQMEGASVRASIERQKLEAWKAAVDAYTAQVGAKQAEFQIYRAGVEGQQAKVGIYESQVRAYGATVAAARTRADVQFGRLQAQAEQARIANTNFQTRFDSFKANVQALLESGRLKVDLYRADVEKFRGVTDGFRANAELHERGIEQTIQQNIQISNVAIENAKAKQAATVEALRFRTAATQYASEKFYAQLLAILNGVNGLAVQTEEV